MLFKDQPASAQEPANVCLTLTECRILNLILETLPVLVLAVLLAWTRFHLNLSSIALPMDAFLGSATQAAISILKVNQLAMVRTPR